MQIFTAAAISLAVPKVKGLPGSAVVGRQRPCSACREGSRAATTSLSQFSSPLLSPCSSATLSEAHHSGQAPASLDLSSSVLRASRCFAPCPSSLGGTPSPAAPGSLSHPGFHIWYPCWLRFVGVKQGEQPAPERTPAKLLR